MLQFRVAPSAIHHQGLFSDMPIPPRKKIGEFTGQKISIREARRRAKGAQRIAIVEIDDRSAVDGSVGGGLFQFINHSCDPNAFIRIAYGRIEFYSRRPIHPEDEITCDYGESHHDGKLPCKCGAVKCRKFI